MNVRTRLYLGVVIVGMPTSLQADDLSSALTTLRSVATEAQGHLPAQAAWKMVAAADASRMTEILAALDGAGPLAANWIRSAVDTILERAAATGDKNAAAELQRYIGDRKHEPQGRRLAYEWLVRFDPSAADRLMPSFLDDP